MGLWEGHIWHLLEICCSGSCRNSIWSHERPNQALPPWPWAIPAPTPTRAPAPHTTPYPFTERLKRETGDYDSDDNSKDAKGRAGGKAGITSRKELAKALTFATPCCAVCVCFV